MPAGWLLPTAFCKAIIIVLEAMNEEVEDAFCWNHESTPIEMTEDYVLQAEDSKSLLI